MKNSDLVNMDFGDYIKKHLEPLKWPTKSDIAIGKAISPLEAQYAPTLKITKRLLTLKEAEDLYGIKKIDLLEYASSGSITLCYPVKKTESILWVISKEYLKLCDTSITPSKKECLKISVEANKEDRVCPDPQKTEWVTLSQDDCKRIFLAGNHSQSVFDGGWTLNENSEFQSTYPRFQSYATEFMPTAFRVDLWTFKLYQREHSHLVNHDYTFIPENEYEIKFDIENLLVPSIDMDQLIEKQTIEKALRKQDKLSISSDEYKTLLNHANFSTSLRYICVGSRHFWKKYKDKKKKNPEATFAKNDEIIKYFTSKNSGFKDLSTTMAAEAARIIKPENPDSETLATAETDEFLTKKLLTLIKASHDLWSNVDPQERDTYPDPNVLVRYLMERGGFAQSAAETAVAIITPDNCRKGRPPKA